MKTEDIKKILIGESKPLKKEYVSTGSTLLNLACSDNPFNGFAKGHYYFLVGDSASGKTFLSLTCLAEAARNPSFKDYRFIYDNAEDGALMDIEKFFGKKVAEKLEAPSYENNLPVYSSTIEEFYYHIDDAIKANKPFIYILDSMDALSSIEEANKFEEQKQAFKKGKEAAGSYTDGKAKKNSANLRRAVAALKKTGSILIIINQTRDNVTGIGFEKKTRSGGRALRFYACLELWSSIKEKISKIINGKNRQLGIRCQIQLKKNRLTGKERTVIIPIYHSYGIDDIGSCVDFLLDENHWEENKGIINANEFKVQEKRDKLIKYIETNNLEKDLQVIVGEVWNKIEQQCEIKRKLRYI